MKRPRRGPPGPPPWRDHKHPRFAGWERERHRELMARWELAQQEDPSGSLHKEYRRAFRRRFRRPLQRQLFFSFGLAILVAMGVSAWVASALPTSISARPFGRFLAYWAAGIVVWGLAGMWARRLVGPLRELSRAAFELGQGKLQTRAHLPPHGARELLVLGQTFNEMAARIEKQVKEQTELLHAVSHELRTPLTRLRVLLGILADSQTHPKLTQDLEREVLELDQLVGELLAGARVDSGALQVRTLSVRETALACLSRSDAEGASLSVADDAEQVRADPTLLSRALMVLLDNARKHAGGARALHVTREGPLVRFAVIDAGPGFDPADLEQLFRPFSRGRGQLPDETRGLGLGLYLVRRIAEAHGGHAFADDRESGGAAVGFALQGDASAEHEPENARDFR